MTRVRKLHCRPCGMERPFCKEVPNHENHRFLTVVTAGLWGLCWLALTLHAARKPWRCSFCWHRVRP